MDPIDTKNTLRRRVKDADISPRDRLQLLSLVDESPSTEEGAKALTRRIDAALGGPTKNYNTKTPKDYRTK